MFRDNGLILLSIDLQIFAEEDEGRTLEPTEYRLRKAREEGNIPQSQDLASGIVLLLMFWAISFMAMNIFRGVYELFNVAIETIGSKEISVSSINNLIFISGRVVLGFLLPLLLLAVFASILSHGLQTRFSFSWKKIMPEFRRVFDIPRNFKRVFFSRDAFFNLIKTIVKMVVISVALYFVISSEIENFKRIMFNEPMQGFFYVASFSFKVANVAVVALLIFSIFDYLYQRWSFRRSLRMTPRELKQEIKEFEGDPQIRARIRELEQQILQRRSLREVPTSDVVITNPTHYSVALKYDASYMNAPTVVAKGIDALALQIRKIAEENGVEIVENRPLARALYYSVDIGEEIPPEYYSIVANILSVVYKKKGKVI
ncbi:MAG: flagellar biosynthesis protein FlhB [Spirochaetia bacterium]|nr:flagellar biosynthesis protein FlhB [Spirochaetota bacterium]MCX8095901.1 flagellar biosynthesis protein FlhB [Spirochaetota bacterium]MDW8112263.1 flagellar biosynthesis protein FlhB [Spirochaetia bacterium]